MEPLESPVLLIIFNRPEETRRILERIAEARPKKLYVAADGPRADRISDPEKCDTVRRIVRERVNWNCEIKTLFRDVNLGCRMAVSSSIDWFFSQEEEGIILEDDTLPDLSFFSFCSELLNKYKADERIGMISGDNFGFGFRRNLNSYFFTRYTHVWGWATWKRVWQGYSVDMNDYNKFRNEDWLRDMFSEDREYNFWKSVFDKVALEKFDTWDFQFVYHNFKNGRLNIMPSVNLVTNIGFNINATHTIGETKYANMKTEKMSFPLIHPEFFIVDQRSTEISRISFLPPVENSKVPAWKSVLKKIMRKVRII